MDSGSRALTGSYTHDGVVKSVTVSEGATHSIQYNVEGNLAGFTDATLHPSTIDYGGSGLPSAIRSPGRGTLSFLRDAADQVIGRTSTAGVSSARVLDKHGRAVKEPSASRRGMAPPAGPAR